ncbi:PREDICTED: probable mediator of RNA polymerase II transcription subunit 19b isoform X2 [Lupinus angustifolius]|uniref:probable mediator of RNA polymerase II transcription subunit 19b isoform X2 n=1 Tax=Lupinus angustifolius TaxID=3871 RepID=UPI00092E830A|nr:PREDICTED: probable mediator of RNA polymerase II transcription subunit 19b isoform X2 [Lupinus angustifolius]
MDFEGKSFGRGHKELGGAHDLISQYKLWPYYQFFCKRSHPASISETHYLRNVVGDTKIRKGEGMELDQLRRNASMREKETCLHPFDLDVLSEAFHMKEMNPIRLSSKGLATPVSKSVNQCRHKEDKDRKDKDKNRKGEKHTRHKPHQVKDGSCIENNRICPKDSHPSQLKIQLDKVSSQSFQFSCITCVSYIKLNVACIILSSYKKPNKSYNSLSLFFLHATSSYIESDST